MIFVHISLGMMKKATDVYLLVQGLDEKMNTSLGSRFR
jgi:hypothetical protein